MRGIRVRDEKSEHARAMEMVSPTSLSQVVISVPDPRTRGRKTMRVVAVEAVTAMSTWPAPSRAALRRSPSSRIRRSMDSENHDGVVHQHPHREHEPHHGEDVEARTHEVHDAAGGDDGKGDRHGDDDRGVHPPQEEPQAQGGEERAGETGLFEAVDAGGDLLGLVLPNPQLDALEQRVVVDLFLDDPVDLTHDLDRVGGGLLVDIDGHGVLAVQVAAEG